MGVEESILITSSQCNVKLSPKCINWSWIMSTCNLDLLPPGR